MKNLIKISLVILLGICTSFYPKSVQKQLKIHFKHLVGNQPLVLNNTYYTNIHGEKFNVTKFNYYISNIRLKKANGRWWKQPNSYYLVQSSKPASQVLTIPNIPQGVYKEISFLIGVDKKRNTSGVQEGALDPANDMFWSWNTGYVFLKLEGQTLLPDGQKTKGFRFHSGGFNFKFNNIKQKTLNLQDAPLNVGATSAAKLQVKVDLQKFFGGVKPVKIHQNYSLMSPARVAKVADNYSQTFTQVK
ncbi:MAG TPA: hypothetical protein DCS93_17835 [Microscillaceae bacterium]|nr:hypothetical protein [Microscillaceae bacterium]